MMNLPARREQGVWEMPGLSASKSRWQAAAILVVLLISTGCGALQPPGSDKAKDVGAVQIAADLSAMSAADLTDASMELTLSKGKTVITRQVPITGGTAAVAVENLLEGVWQATLAVKDLVGDTMYSAASAVTINAGTTVTVNLTLRPQPGILEISAWTGDHPALSAAQKARLNINPGGYATLAVAETGAFTGSKELAPGTYDYNVSFYGNGYLVGDLVYESPWTSVTIKPGKKTAVTWNPSTGSGTINGLIDMPPAVPAGLVLSRSTEGLTASWAAVADADLAGYRIYLRQSIFDKFALESDQGKDYTTFLYPANKLIAGQRIEVAVTAYDLAGNESERSPVAALDN